MESAVDARLGAVPAHRGGGVALERRLIDRLIAMITVPVGPCIEAIHRCFDAVEATCEEGEVVSCVGHVLRLASLRIVRR